MANWGNVFQSPLEFRAHIVRDVLETRGIPAMLLNKKMSPYQLGHVEVHVPTERVMEAIHIINQEISFE